MTYPTHHPNYENRPWSDDSDDDQAHYNRTERHTRRAAEWEAEDAGELTDYYLDRHDAATHPEDYLP